MRLTTIQIGDKYFTDTALRAPEAPRTTVTVTDTYKVEYSIQIAHKWEERERDLYPVEYHLLNDEEVYRKR